MSDPNKNKNGNGHNNYDPKVVYEHLGADVWKKTTKGKEKSDVAYTEEIEAELDAEDESETDDK